jgi:hypothetical protein
MMNFTGRLTFTSFGLITAPSGSPVKFHQGGRGDKL